MALMLELAVGAVGPNLSEKPYLIWGVKKIFLHVFSRPEDFCFNESDFSTFSKKNLAIVDLLLLFIQYYTSL